MVTVILVGNRQSSWKLLKQKANHNRFAFLFNGGYLLELNRPPTNVKYDQCNRNRNDTHI